MLSIKGLDREIRDTPGGVLEAFQQCYEKVLGTAAGDRDRVQEDIVQLGPVVNEQQAAMLMQDFT